jgi:hypothetical protein
MSVLLAALAGFTSGAHAATYQATGQVGVVFDFAPFRAGFELVLDGRATLGPARELTTPSVGAAVRAGWRSKAGPTLAVVGRAGVVNAAGCDGGQHLALTGIEAEGGVELGATLPPTGLVGVDAVLGSFWFGFASTTHLNARIRNGFAGLQVGHDLGAALVYPDCGWQELE